MGAIQFTLMCLLSFAAGDISEKLKQGQGLSPRESAEFLGLLAPFQDGQRPNVKGGRPSGIKGGGIKGGAQGTQVGAGASNAQSRAPIPFRDHTGDDDENNLDRLCNDAFHSFLCKPVGPRRNRIDGRLRPGAQIPPGVLTGASSNLLESKKVPTQSGGALKPTELDNDDGYNYPKPTDDGYNYPKPTNNIDTLVSPGYSYPKPPYNYEKPSNQLAYPSQVSESIQKPSNEYLPSFSTTPAPQITTVLPTTQSKFAPVLKNLENFNSPLNQVPAQTNPQPVVLNQISPQFTPKPFQQQSLPQAFPVFSPQTYEYTFPQTTFATQSFPIITPPSSPGLSLFTYTRKPTPDYSFAPSTVSLPYVYTGLPSTTFTSPGEEQPFPSNNDGYIYPKPSNDNPIFLPSQAESASSALPQFPNNGYLPPVGAPVPKASNVIFNSLPQSSPSPVNSFPTTQRTPVFQTSTLRPISFPQTLPPSTNRPPNIITTPKPFTFRPYTFQTTTVRPIVYQTTQTPSTLRSFVFTTTTTTPKPPAFNFAASNDIPVSQPRQEKPKNGYLPPVNQPIPAPANEFKNVLPFNPQSPFPPNIIRGTTPRPTLPPTTRPPPPPPTTKPPPPPPPSKQYLPQIDPRIEGSSTNVSPNIEGGSLLAAEGDAPQPDIQGPTTERTHTLEEFCRDAFHSFLCKPIDKPRKRIDGRIRPGAKIPPNVMSQLLSAASSPAKRKLRPSQSSSSLQSGSQTPRTNVYQINVPAYQPTNVSPQLFARPGQSQPSLFLLAASDSSSLAKAYLKQSNQNVSTTHSKYIPPYTAQLNYIQGTIKETPSAVEITTTTPTSTTIRTRPTTIRQTTFREPTTRPTNYKTTTMRPSVTRSPSRPRPKSSTPLQVAASATDVQSVPKKPKPETGGQLLSTDNEGYNYPKPAKPFQFPTTQKPGTTGYQYSKPPKPLAYPTTVAPAASSSLASTGYTYPKPRRPFTFPVTQGPRTTRPSPSRPAFGQRLRPTQTGLQQQQQQQLEQQQQEQIQEDPFSQNEVPDKDNGLPPASQFEILKP